MEEHEVIIGECTKPNYVVWGKLSDGTPVYKYEAPDTVSQEILQEQKAVASQQLTGSYNSTVKIKDTDTSQFVSELAKQESIKKDKNAS
tara:strand:+ start:433 stop:699 length:267 start_codon:yes stop_codon:yes gene_type:complete